MTQTKYWLALAILTVGSLIHYPAMAAAKPDESVKIALSGQLETSIHRFGQASRRILWLTTHETKKADFSLAKQLADAGLEVWIAPLEAKTKQAKNTQALTVAAVAELIEESFPSQIDHKLYVFSTGDSAKAALEGLKTWQDARGSSAQLGGLILAYPHLQLGSSKTKAAKFIEASYQLKLPVYIFQAAKKLKLETAESLVAAFEQGGSTVYSEVVKDVADGYLQGKANSEEEILQLSVFPAQLSQALDKLSETPLKSAEPAVKLSEQVPLQEHPTKELAPELRLEDLNGKTHDLKDYRGKVVLLNFWATWCPPCIKEIPSINNLQKHFSSDDFVVLSVDVGEELKDVQAFLEHIPADYPVLLDSESSLTSTWQLTAFPSTFIIDRTGHLRYMYFGGLEWDEPQITKFLEKNLEIVAK